MVTTVFLRSPGGFARGMSDTLLSPCLERLSVGLNASAVELAAGAPFCLNADYYNICMSPDQCDFTFGLLNSQQQTIPQDLRNAREQASIGGGCSAAPSGPQRPKSMAW